MPEETVKEARARIGHHLACNVAGGKEQIVCPCCGQTVAARRRAITSEMARALILLVRAWWNVGMTGWISIRTIPVRGGDYAKLRYWGLIERLAPDAKDSNQRDSAYWRPTLAGIAFARGDRTVDKTVYVYNNQTTIDPEAGETNIHDALGEKFDWYKLMGIRRPEGPGS